MENKILRQTTFRVDPELLRNARYYLDKEGLSVAQFLVQQLEKYVQEHEEDSPRKRELAHA
jgi:hypothetical protein